MDPLTKMLISLIAILAMFLANIFILLARNKLNGILKWGVSLFAYLLLVISLIFILIVLFAV